MSFTCARCKQIFSTVCKRQNRNMRKTYYKLCKGCIIENEIDIKIQDLLDKHEKESKAKALVLQVRNEVKEIELKNKARVSANKRRIAKTNSKGTHDDKYIEYLLTKQKYKCVACLASIAEMFHVDHIYPLSKGGGNGEDNIQLLCQPCNNKKHAKDPIWFLQKYNLRTYCEL